MMRILALLFALLVGGVQLGQAQLPGPLPQLESIVTGTPSPGHIFIGPRSRFVTDTIPGSIMICDSIGRPVWHYSLINNANIPYANSYPVDFKLLNDSTMSFCTRRTGDYEFHFLDTDFNLIDTFTCFDTDEHELIQDNQGNVYYLCKEYEQGDCSVLTQANGNPGNPNCTILSNTLRVEDPSGNILWTWNTLDHVPLQETQSDYYVQPGFIDQAHTNSIAFDLDSNLVLSNRNNFQIVKINRITGDIMWRFGGITNEFTLVGDTIEISGQHDARIAPNGNLYLFDNGAFANIARYVEYELDTVAMTATLVREHRHPSFENAAIMGGSQLLPDSNVIVCWGGVFFQSTSPKITEFEPDGSITMQVRFPEGYTSYRAQKTPIPFTIPRPILTCDNGNMTLSAPAGYDTYAWNTGDTTQSISISATGTYQVWVNLGVGLVSSEEFVVSSLNDICTPVGRPEPQIGKVSLTPNPAGSEVRIEIPAELSSGWEIEVMDLNGRVVASRNGKGLHDQTFPLQGWVPGVYVIRINGKSRTYLGKLVRL